MKSSSICSVFSFSRKHSGFTLVELIVVITILAILATVGFVVMSHQTSVARDGKRISEIQSLSSASRITTAQLRELPRPIADSLELTVSGSFIGYQGFMSKSLVNPIGYGSDKIYDPLDGTPYTYRVSKNYDQAQFMTYLENPRFERSIEIAKQTLPSLLVSQAYALDTSNINFTKRYPYSAGDRLGIFIEKNTQIPLQSGVTGTGSRDISLSDTSTLTIIVGSSGADGYVSTDISTGSLLSLKDGSFDEKALFGMSISESSGSGAGGGGGGGGGNSCPTNPTAESYFTFDSNNGTITGYDEVNGPLDVVIPCTINGVSVVSIGNDAFQNNQLTSVVIPNSMTSIGNDAFAGNQLTTINIPNSVTNIGYQAFYDNHLISVHLPENLTTIAFESFTLNQITSINIPNSVVDIGYNAFMYNQLSTVNIPNGVVSIGVNAFFGNQITSVSIPNSVISLSGFGNNQLTSISIPNSVTHIEDSAFMSNQLSTVNIPNSVVSIGVNAFGYNQLTSVSIPNSVISLSGFGNNQLTSVSIPNNVTSIGDYAFPNNQLTSVIIPNSITSIEAGAFMDNQLTSIDIPSSVTSIGNYAFMSNNLAAVYILNSIISIGDYVFFNQTNSVGNGTVYGPASGYVKNTYINNSNGQFDKTKLPNYVDLP